MVPNSSRVTHYRTATRHAEFIPVAARVLPRALEGLETTALYLVLATMWGLVLMAVLMNGL